MGLTEHQQKQRSGGIGSSEIAMLIIREDGQPLSPFGGPHTLWRRKKGIDLPEEESGAMTRGTRLEPVIAQWWSDDHGLAIRKARTRRHPKFTYCVDSCDYIAYQGQKKRENAVGCLEVKAITPTNYHKWGDPGTDQIPLEYAVQCQWHLGHHGLPVCYVAADTAYDRADYEIEADPELFTALVSVAERFWTDCVEGDNEPPADRFDGTSKWLSTRLKVKGEELLPAPDEIVATMQRIRALALDAKTIGAELQTLENQIKQEIGETAGFYVRGSKQKITFKLRKGRPKLDVDALLAELVGDDAERAAALKEKHTARGDGFRQLDKRALLNNEPPEAEDHD